MKKFLTNLAYIFLAVVVALMATGVGFVLPVMGITELGMSRQTLAIIAMVFVCIFFVAIALISDEPV